jgi:hypothetical protein
MKFGLCGRISMKSLFGMTTCRKIALYCALIIITISTSTGSMFAQNTTADVVGTVTDNTGAAIPNAQVELANVDTQERRDTAS